jgi:hypothetical protein
MSSVKYGGVSSNSATVEATKFAGPYKSHEKPSSQFLGLIVMSHSLGEVWIRIQDISVVLPLFYVSLENHVYLSRGVQVIDAAWRIAMKIVAGVGDLV